MIIPSFKRNKELSFAEDGLYNIIKKYCGEFDLKNQEIASEIGMDKSTVIRFLTKLEKMGFIYRYSFDGHRRVLKAKRVK